MHSKRFPRLVKFTLLTIALILTMNLSVSHADLYVIAGGGRKVGTEIKALPYTISESGFYFITKDLNCPVGNDGITIKKSNVTLDLMGFSLTGVRTNNGKDGILIKGVGKDIEIRNGVICGFDRHGIVAESGTEGIRVIGLRVKDNLFRAGIYLLGINNMVRDFTCSENAMSGIYCGNGSLITGNTCYRNNYGIKAEEGCTITNNTCFQNDEGMVAGLGSTIIGNTCRSNTVYGIKLAGDSYVGQNTCTDNITNMNDCPQDHPCSKGLNHAP